MDFTLRCNSLKCRAQLAERAVVTTCSHVFCVNCSDALGLSNASGNDRICPACQTRLINVDDAVATTLNPSEDYKTSVLSGLSPSIIMECAGRGLAFYGYQASQEIVYQEHLARGLAGKHNILNTQMDQIIHEANAEITNLRNKISALELDQESLRRKNGSLRDAYSEKVRQYQKCQTNYDKMRKKVLDSDVQLAAEDAVEDTLNMGGATRSYGPAQRFTVDSNGVEVVHQRQKSGGSGSGERLYHSSQPSYQASLRQPWQEQQNTSTPSIHRTRLPVPTPQAAWAVKPSEIHRGSNSRVSTVRQPLESLGANLARPMAQYRSANSGRHLGPKYGQNSYH